MSPGLHTRRPDLSFRQRATFLAGAFFKVPLFFAAFPVTLVGKLRTAFLFNALALTFFDRKDLTVGFAFRCGAVKFDARLRGRLVALITGAGFFTLRSLVIVFLLAPFLSAFAFPLSTDDAFLIAGFLKNRLSTWRGTRLRFFPLNSTDGWAFRTCDRLLRFRHRNRANVLRVLNLRACLALEFPRLSLAYWSNLATFWLLNRWTLLTLVFTRLGLTNWTHLPTLRLLDRWTLLTLVFTRLGLTNWTHLPTLRLLDRWTLLTSILSCLRLFTEWSNLLPIHVLKGVTGLLYNLCLDWLRLGSAFGYGFLGCGAALGPTKQSALTTVTFPFTTLKRGDCWCTRLLNWRRRLLQTRYRRRILL